MQYNKKIHKSLFVLGIAFNIGLLGYFKYADFFISSINAAFTTSFNLLHILLPLGISFFTFQQFSFLLSVYKGTEQVDTFVNYCLFVTFFPQLIAGPIVTYSEMMPQFKVNKSQKLTADNMAAGIYVFVLGLFKKIVVADTLAIFVDNGFNMSSGLGFSAAWATSLSYTLQIYFDFSGYSDMALGLGRMFNINLPVNFDSPYKSEGMNQFWRRWHMTLGRALSTFIYIPLGGNRKGKIRTYVNLFVTFFVSGIWHGAGWTFVVWGALHGLLVIIDRAFGKAIKTIPRFIKIFITFVTVNILWVLFRAPSFNEAINIYRGMLSIKYLNMMQLRDIAFDHIINFPDVLWILYILTILFACLIVCFFFKNTVEKANQLSKGLTFRSALVSTILFILSVVTLSRMSVFIYFNF